MADKDFDNGDEDDFGDDDDPLQSELLKQNLKKNKTLRIFTKDNQSSTETYQLSNDEIEIPTISLTEAERQAYKQKFNTLSQDIGYNQRLNKLLLRKCCDYFKRKKLEHVFSEVEDYQKVEYQYQKLLNQYSETKESFEIEQKQIQDGLDQLKSTYNQKLTDANQRFSDVIQKKLEICADLVAHEKRNHFHKKVVGKLVQQEMVRYQQMNECRLEFVKFKNSVAQLQNRIKNFENFHQGLRLVDFEQLQSKNEHLSSKIEEKNDNLAKLRDTYEKNCALIVFLNEKMQLNSHKLEDLEEESTQLETLRTNLRKQLNDMKKARERSRNEIDVLTEQCGLLRHPKLLKHMQKLLDEFDKTQEQYLLLKVCLLFKKCYDGGLIHFVNNLNFYIHFTEIFACIQIIFGTLLSALFLLTM